MVLRIIGPFVLLLPPEFLQKLPIPRPIAELLTKKRNATATLFSPLGKFWHITLVRDGDDRLYFDNGWREFSQAHELVAGDFVLFRYEGNMVFKAKVFDTSGCRKLRDDQQDTEEPRTPPGFSAKKKSVENENSAPCPPHFEKIMRSCNVSGNIRRRLCLSVPMSFRSSYGLLRREIVLKDPKKRSWPVTLWNGKRDSRIHRGWREFAVGNNLEEGDKCIFQLISSGEMRVLIRKRCCA
ncbi:putative B3 domain-containing protein Os04g0347400 isoform X2 [Ananas comosus]|uniref:B3 domain-containing protein Os04g0347400 isoform X2 n=1 Tax=Ananas comosus TaxID=4615 RepID=A0A6P5G3U8_ANACO|nr:putative B3 domain-containing protein Os04g0347400 isoform X2 [Ananas comosus]